MSLVPQFFCPRPWETMDGDEAERFCMKCGHSVHNLQLLPMARKLALLRSPRSSMCGRYRIAIRQAVPGREPSYFEHLLKYGASVALTSAAFITLWEISADSERASGHGHFRVAPEVAGSFEPMAPELYFETNSIVLGMLGSPPWLPPPGQLLPPPAMAPLDIHLNPVELQKLLPTSLPAPYPLIESPQVSSRQ